MDNAWTQHIPMGFMLEHLERPQVDRLGGPPPIRIVMDVSLKVDAEKVATITIKLGTGSK